MKEYLNTTTRIAAAVLLPLLLAFTPGTTFFEEEEESEICRGCDLTFDVTSPKKGIEFDYITSEADDGSCRLVGKACEISSCQIYGRIEIKNTSGTDLIACRNGSPIQTWQASGQYVNATVPNGITRVIRYALGDEPVIKCETESGTFEVNVKTACSAAASVAAAELTCSKCEKVKVGDAK